MKPQTRAIPRSGEDVPVIGLGTWRSFDVSTTPAALAPLDACVTAFEALGGRVIDSSPMYGRAERVIGDLTSASGLRPRLFIATKVWTSGKQQGIDQMRESMRKLRVSQVDLMQVHNLVDVSTHLATLRQWKADGTVRYIGVTHYTASAHREVVRILQRETIDFVQINYSVAEREAERSVLPAAADRGVAVIVNRPFATGVALGRLRPRQLPPWAAEVDCTSWAQLLLKFVVSHPAVTCVIPATSSADHLRDNMQAGVGRMPDADLREEIARLAR
jgi:diketogulonate reductase-like aldo/keto reductase